MHARSAEFGSTSGVQTFKAGPAPATPAPYKREQTHLCTVHYPSITGVHHFTLCTACCVRCKVLACSGNHLNSKVDHIYIATRRVRTAFHRLFSQCCCASVRGVIVARLLGLLRSTERVNCGASRWLQCALGTSWSWLCSVAQRAPRANSQVLNFFSIWIVLRVVALCTTPFAPARQRSNVPQYSQQLWLQRSHSTCAHVRRSVLEAIPVPAHARILQ